MTNEEVLEYAELARVEWVKCMAWELMDREATEEELALMGKRVFKDAYFMGFKCGQAVAKE